MNITDGALRAFITPPPGRSGRRPIYDLSAHRQPKTAVRQILELDALLAPDFFNGAHGRAPRLCLALLEFMDGALGQSDVKTKLALAPAQYGARRPDPGGKHTPFKPDKLDEIARLVCTDLHGLD